MLIQVFSDTMMKSRGYIGNLRHAVVRLLRLASADLLHMPAQPKRLHHQLEMDPVIFLGA